MLAKEFDPQQIAEVREIESEIRTEVGQPEQAEQSAQTGQVSANNENNIEGNQTNQTQVRQLPPRVGERMGSGTGIQTFFPFSLQLTGRIRRGDQAIVLTFPTLESVQGLMDRERE